MGKIAMKDGDRLLILRIGKLKSARVCNRYDLYSHIKILTVWISKYVDDKTRKALIVNNLNRITDPSTMLDYVNMMLPDHMHVEHHTSLLYISLRQWFIRKFK